MNDYKEYEYEVEHDIFDLIILYKYENVRDGYRLINAPGHKKQCVNSNDGKKCKKGQKSCENVVNA